MTSGSQAAVEASAQRAVRGSRTMRPSCTKASTASTPALAMKSVPRTPMTAMGVFKR